MKSPDDVAIPQSLREALPDLPIEGDRPVFAEPWHAEVFSIACLLHENGHFTWTEWARTLGAVIAEMPDDTAYYQCWLTALERLTLHKGILDAGLLQDRYNAWDEAARSTPHGKPIKLKEPQ
ncbi:MAG: nitrile hydratase accessory protein [Pseudomonadota bacterium]